jgi:hypothetical protein
MQYVKPQISIVNNAVNAIQSTEAMKGFPFVTDNADGSQRLTATNTAYEADE